MIDRSEPDVNRTWPPIRRRLAVWLVAVVAPVAVVGAAVVYAAERVPTVYSTNGHLPSGVPSDGTVTTTPRVPTP